MYLPDYHNPKIRRTTTETRMTRLKAVGKGWLVPIAGGWAMNGERQFNSEERNRL
jgi:hypothetical protein